jgi:hypothetical protein
MSTWAGNLLTITITIHEIGIGCPSREQSRTQRTAAVVVAMEFSKMVIVTTGVPIRKNVRLLWVRPVFVSTPSSISYATPGITAHQSPAAVCLFVTCGQRAGVPFEPQRKAGCTLARYHEHDTHSHAYNTHINITPASERAAPRVCCAPDVRWLSRTARGGPARTICTAAGASTPSHFNRHSSFVPAVPPRCAVPAHFGCAIAATACTSGHMAWPRVVATTTARTHTASATRPSRRYADLKTSTVYHAPPGAARPCVARPPTITITDFTSRVGGGNIASLVCLIHPRRGRLSRVIGNGTLLHEPYLA